MLVSPEEEQTAPPVFSVILPTHDRAHLLPRAIRSALNQTFRSLELVIVDDGSADNTAEVVGSFEDERIAYVPQEIRRGVAAATNVGIRRARGQYIAFLGSDDEYLPEFLSIMQHALGTAPGEVGFAWCGIRQVEDGPDEEHIRREVIWSKPGFDSGRDAQRWLLRKGPGTGYLVVRARCFEQMGLFDEQLQSAVDLDLIIRLAQHFDYRVVPQVLVVVHQSLGSQVSHPGLVRAQAYSRIAGKHNRFLRQHPFLLIQLHTQAAVWSYQAGDKALARRETLRSLRLSPFRWRFGWRIPLYFELFGEPLPPVWRGAAAGIRHYVRWLIERVPKRPK